MSSAPTVCVPAVQKPWYLPWADLVSFRPPKEVQDHINTYNAGYGLKYWATQRIESGDGQVNIDYYPVTVKKLPNFPTGPYGAGMYGNPSPPAPIPMNADDLLYYIRTTLIDKSLGFEPYDTKYSVAGGDAARWVSTSPVNSIISIVLAAVDDGSVICSEADSRHWRFSTIFTAEDKAHAVSGTREWGYMKDEATGNYIYYTRGNDRMTRLVDHLFGGVPNISWNAADTLWKTLQSRIYNHVTAYGGDAEIGDTRCNSAVWSPYYEDNRISRREDWSKVKADIWKPTETWYYSDPLIRNL